MTIAASGMAAAMNSLTASASNLANAQNAGPVGSAYQPAVVIQTSMSDGTVSARIIRPPNYLLAYSPALPFANAQGMVAVPNVDQVVETVNQISASLAFRANLKVFKAAARNEKSLLDMLT